jgi:cold shock protein
MTGVIAKLVLDRGFGFIQPDGKTKDIFFHFSSLDESLPFDEALQERRVVFDVLDTQKGLAAVGIRTAT